MSPVGCQDLPAAASLVAYGPCVKKSGPSVCPAHVCLRSVCLRPVRLDLGSLDPVCLDIAFCLGRVLDPVFFVGPVCLDAVRLKAFKSL